MAPCAPHVARLHDAPSPRPRQYATSHPVPLDTFPHSNAGDNASRSHQCLETIFTTDSEGTFWATIVLQTATRRRETVRSRRAHRARGRSRERQTASCVSPWRPPAAFQLRQRRAANHTPRQPRQPRQRRHKSVWHSAVGDAGGRLARKRTCASHSLVGQQFSARRGDRPEKKRKSRTVRPGDPNDPNETRGQSHLGCQLRGATRRRGLARRSGHIRPSRRRVRILLFKRGFREKHRFVFSDRGALRLAAAEGGVVRAAATTEERIVGRERNRPFLLRLAPATGGEAGSGARISAREKEATSLPETRLRRAPSFGLLRPAISPSFTWSIAEAIIVCGKRH